MKRVLLLLTFLTTNLALLANNEKQFLDSNFEPVSNQDEAMYYRMTTDSLDSLYSASVYYLNDELQMKGNYSDEKLTILHGSCSYFYKNGQKESEGLYHLGERIGVWKRFDLFGDKKVDKYYPSKKELSKNKFKTKMASFEGGKNALDAYLVKSIIFPKKAELLGVSLGEVNISLEIDADGFIVGYDVLASTGDVFSQEAVRVITEMPNWNPALRDGKPVKSSYIISIPFVQ